MRSLWGLVGGLARPLRLVLLLLLSGQPLTGLLIKMRMVVMMAMMVVETNVMLVRLSRQLHICKGLVFVDSQVFSISTQVCMKNSCPLKQV